MGVEEANRRVWGDRDIALEYATSELQPGEAAILDSFRDRVSGGRVLDVGCGAGRTVPALLDLAGDYTGIDYSQAMIDVSRDRFPDGRFITCDVRDLSRFESNSFDFALFSYNGLDCMSHDDRLTALGELSRVVDDGGLFAFSSHNRNFPVEPPRLELSTSPRGLARNLKHFAITTLNHWRQRAFEVRDDSHAILNDSSHDYAVLTYYIDRAQQEAQLQRSGFSLRVAYDIEGRALRDGEDDAHTPWIYYGAEKQER